MLLMLFWGIWICLHFFFCMTSWTGICHFFTNATSSFLMWELTWHDHSWRGTIQTQPPNGAGCGSPRLQLQLKLNRNSHQNQNQLKSLFLLFLRPFHWLAQREGHRETVDPAIQGFSNPLQFHRANFFVSPPSLVSFLIQFFFLRSTIPYEVALFYCDNYQISEWIVVILLYAKTHT